MIPLKRYLLFPIRNVLIFFVVKYENANEILFFSPFNKQERQFSHIGPNHLLEICSRISGLLNKEIPPSITGITTLLGAGKQSVLRTQEKCNAQKSIVDYCTRFHAMPTLDSNRQFTHNIGKLRSDFWRQTPKNPNNKNNRSFPFDILQLKFYMVVSHLGRLFAS